MKVNWSYLLFSVLCLVGLQANASVFLGVDWNFGMFLGTYFSFASLCLLWGIPTPARNYSISRDSWISSVLLLIPPLLGFIYQKLV